MFSRPIDTKLFHEQYEAFDARRETPRELLLLLALTKINAAEAYGIQVTKQLRKDDEVTELEQWIALEEHYHPRILLSSARHFGLFFFQAEDGIRDGTVTGVQTCALPI